MISDNLVYREELIAGKIVMMAPASTSHTLVVWGTPEPIRLRTLRKTSPVKATVDDPTPPGFYNSLGAAHGGCSIAWACGP